MKGSIQLGWILGLTFGVACGEDSGAVLREDGGNSQMPADQGSEPVDGGATRADMGRTDAGRGPMDGGTDPEPPCVAPGEMGACTLQEFPGRPYLVWVPAVAAGERLPVVLAFHGGAGNPLSGARNTCPGGGLEEPGCLHAVGNREGFITVYPSGTESALGPTRRIWNAGGGADGWACVGFCDPSIDEAGYIGAVLDDLASDLPVDLDRVYATGLSNGAAVVHRLGCELADRLAAIAPIGGGNQFATSADCTPSRPMPILYIHGTADACWLYEGGPIACGSGMNPDPAVSVGQSMAGWAERNDCRGEPETLPGPNPVDDGIEVVEHRWRDCEAPTRHFEVVGGGHTWLGGNQYLPADQIGPRFPDVTNQDLWDFFEAHRL
jgi:polyhydroxybutyrate depolymerase